MAATNLNEIIGYAPLTESLKTTASGIPNPFPPELFQVRPGNKILGDRAKYIRVTGERRTAKFAKYGSPSAKRPLRDIADQAVRMLHVYEHFDIELTQLLNLRSFEQYTQDKGIEWLKYQMDEAAVRPANTRIISVASVLRYGKIFIDVYGNILPSSTGADLIVDFNVPAANQNQLNGILSAPWTLPNTNIPGQINALQAYALATTGLRLETALYGKNVLKYLTQNDYILDYLARNDKGRNQLLYDNTVPAGLFGIQDWRPVYTSFFEDDNQVIQEMWNDDLIVFLPSMNQPDKMNNWWSGWEGSYPVPRRLDILRDGRDPFANHEIVYGMFGYAMPNNNGVPSYTVHTGDTFLFGPRNEKAMFQAIVAF